MLAWAAQWQSFSSFYGGSWRWRQQDVLLRSLDGFTHERNFTLSPLLGSRLVRFEKRAGTDLLDFETWRALDTLSLHQPRYVVFGSMRERTAIAWGGADNGVGSTLRGRWDLRRNRVLWRWRSLTVRPFGLICLMCASRHPRAPLQTPALAPSIGPRAVVRGAFGCATAGS